MLARRAASEVGIHDEDPRALILSDVERMPVVRADRRLAVVLEHVPLEPFEADADEKPGRHDAIGVDVVATKRQRAALNSANCWHEHMSQNEPPSVHVLPDINDLALDRR